MTPSTSQTIDVNIPRFNQAVVAAATAVAFVTQAPALVAVTFAVLVISWAGGPRLAPLTRLYVAAIRPRVDPDGPSELEPAAPPRFAQMVGSVFLGVATVALASGLTGLGWGLVLIVTALAALAATTRICVGCIFYEKVVAR